MIQFWNRAIVVFIAVLISSFSYSQEKKGDLFPVDDIYFKKWGWLAGIGANYSIPLSGEVNQVDNSNLDTISNYLFSPKGKVGAMLEGGAFYMLDNPIVSLLDAELRVNWFAGKEDFTENRTSGINNDTILNQSGIRNFDQFNASIRLNANNTIQVSQYGFIQNTLGVNFDYLFHENLQTDTPTLAIPDPSDKFQIQLHYKLSYGLRLDLMHYMIVGVDIPIITLYPWQDGRQTINVFESQYWPLTVSVQFLFLQKSNRPDCRKPQPLDMNKKRKKAKMY